MALERVNYYTGQRLNADDLRDEQHYQERVRRLLNHGLFTPGVVEGLEVSRIPGGVLAPRTVRVAPGASLDALGRLIVLDAAVDVAVPNQPPLGGTNYYYLVLRYAEEPIPGRADECAAPGTAPADRIRELAVLDWSEVIPFPRPTDPADSIEHGVVIALVELDKDCKIAAIDPAARRLSFPRNVSRVQTVAYEGEKDIAEGDSKKLYFHIRGGRPSAVVLYLRGDKFSSTAYTEIAAHAHTLSGTAIGDANVTTQNHSHDTPPHAHDLTHGATHDAGMSEDGSHRHAVMVRDLTTNDHPRRAVVTDDYYNVIDGFLTIGYQEQGYTDNAPTGLPREQKYIELSGSHTHQLDVAPKGPLGTGSMVPAPTAVPHSHTFATTVNAAGSTGVSPRGGAVHTFPTDVRVALDGLDITQRLVAALPGSWTALGGTLGGDEQHPFNQGGTGPLDLVQLGLTLGPGEHLLELSAPARPAGLPPVGGKVIYHLYVE
jgi:hypothetical protein